MIQSNLVLRYHWQTKVDPRTFSDEFHVFSNAMAQQIGDAYRSTVSSVVEPSISEGLTANCWCALTTYLSARQPTSQCCLADSFLISSHSITHRK